MEADNDRPDSNAYLNVREISATETIPLRHTVLRPHMTVQDCIYPGDDLATSFHLGGFSGGVLATVLSVVLDSSPIFDEQVQYRFRAMATDSRFHRRGFAKSVVAAAEQKVLARGGSLIWFNAREAAFGFYEKTGYRHHGDFFEIPGIGMHKIMWKRIGQD